MAIKNLVGEWILEENDIKEFIRSGFSGIYTTSHEAVSRDEPSFVQYQASLSDGERESINEEVTETEIKAALWALKPFKAPGPDGLLLPKILVGCGGLYD